MRIAKMFAKCMAKASLSTAKAASSSASLFGYHQPKEPKQIKGK